jgi:protocatechuate 3,4-dioxygenase beta subunit
LPAEYAPQNGPGFGPSQVFDNDADLTVNGRTHAGSLEEPVGERIIVTGRVLDENGFPVPHTLIEIWQANAAGRYIHSKDNHNAPLDPNFFGAGRCATDEKGVYRFLTVKPGAYPWPNHYNAWRPAHIHLSLFGPVLGTRLVTQMYFPADPLLEFDPIYQAVPKVAQSRLVAQFDIEETEEAYALGYRFDVILRGRHQTPMEG